tara:strand:+ start:23 stop:583 length:561 start_codon:yes stop_codon:yes gene_type:complete
VTTKESSLTGSLSDRYAYALYDLATEKNNIEKVIEDLEQLLGYFNNSTSFALLLNSPLISSEDKLKFLNHLLKKNNSHKLVINLIRVLKKNKRFSLLSHIIRKFKSINAEKRGDITTEIISAKELSKIQKDKIQTQLRTILGKKLSLNYNVDRSIMAGLIIKFGSTMIDSSLINKINKLQLAMKEA